MDIPPAGRLTRVSKRFGLGSLAADGVIVVAFFVLINQSWSSWLVNAGIYAAGLAGFAGAGFAVTAWVKGEPRSAAFLALVLNLVAGTFFWVAISLLQALLAAGPDCPEC